MLLLVVDDEPRLVRTIELGWPDPQDEIVSAFSYADVRGILHSSRLLDFDCIILDLQLPDASGSTILSEIRERTSTPVIMLSAWGDTQFRADLIGAGADDYVMKPVGVKELHARVKRLAGRRASQAQAVASFDIGALSFDVQGRELRSGDRREPLTGAECSILSALALAMGGIVSREQLYLKGFGRVERQGEKSLEAYIGRLRRKLSDLGEDGARWIVTERGRGYRLQKDTV